MPRLHFSNIANHFRSACNCLQYGAFLIAYGVALAIGAYPLFLIEYGISQFSGKSPINMWAICPLLKGAGYGSIIVSSFMSLYFNVMVSWIIVYMFNSFSLPWTSCNNSWNSAYCFNGRKTNLILHNISNSLGYNFSSKIKVLNMSVGIPDKYAMQYPKVTPNEEFWRVKVLGLSSGINDMGTVQLDLLGGLIFAWIFIFLCLAWGIKVTGKAFRHVLWFTHVHFGINVPVVINSGVAISKLLVVYFTACFPYVVLLSFLIKGVTLPGAIDGIKFYLIPKWKSLFSTKVLGEAATMVIISAGIGYGGLNTLASYNNFYNNVYRNALISPAINAGTSFFAGFVTFSLLGHMAHEKGVPVDDTAVQGPGLIFEAYPSAISKYPLPHIWSFLFFFMMFTIAIDSQIGLVETVICGLMDEYTVFRKRRLLLVSVYCLLQFLLGIPLIMQGGMYILQVIDWYHGLFTLIIVAFLECIVIGWVYGADRFLGNIEQMIGYKPCKYWSFFWKYITPPLLLAVLVFNMIQLTPVSYGTYQYPTWAIGMGWIIGLISVAPMVIAAIPALVKSKGTIIQRIRQTLSDSDEWGPSIRGSGNKTNRYDSVNDTEKDDKV